MGLVVAHISSNQSEAQTIASSLNAAGIFVSIPDDNLSSIMPHLSVGLDGIRVMVSSEQLDDARALINDQLGQSSGLETHSEAFQHQKSRGLFGVLALLFGGVWLPWWSKHRKWKEKDKNNEGEH